MPPMPADRQPKTAAEWIERHRTIGDFERVGYVGLGERYNKCLYALRRRHFLRLAKRLGIAPPMRALDVGAGTGFYVELFQSLGITDVTGVDISPEAVDRLRERFPGCRFAVADITSAPPSNLSPAPKQPRDGANQRRNRADQSRDRADQRRDRADQSRDRKGAVGIPNETRTRIDEHAYIEAAPSPNIADPARWHVVTAMDVLFHIIEDALFEKALRHCADAVTPGGLLLISDNFPKRRRPADTSQAYRTMDDHMQILEPLGFGLRTISPVFFVSNGQVSGGGAWSRFAAWKWRLFTRCLGKLIRTAPRLGETAGALTGAALTRIDSLLQRQTLVRGYSTKIAVFQRK